MLNKCENVGTNSCGLTLQEIYNFILNINEAISSLACKKIKNYCEGYDCEADTSDLHLYKEILEKFVQDSLRGAACNDSVDKIISKLHKYIPKIKDIEPKFDSSKEAQWIKDNVACTTKEKWKKLAYKICYDIDLDVRLIPEETVCDLALEIKLGTLDCNVVEAISVASVSCQNEIKVSRTEEECKIDYELLLENVQNAPCLETYMIAVTKHNMTYDQIVDIYLSGASIEKGENGCELKTALRSYPLSELSFKAHFKSEEIKNELIPYKPSKLKKYTQDY